MSSGSYYCSPKLNWAGELPPMPRGIRQCGLGYRPSNHLGSLGLPTSVQNKVLRLLMIKMCPAPCPSAMGLQGGQRSSEPLSPWADGAQSPHCPPRAQASSHSSHAGEVVVLGGSHGGLRCKEYNKQNCINTTGKSLPRKHVAYGTFLTILKVGIKMLNDNKKGCPINAVLASWGQALGTGWGSPRTLPWAPGPEHAGTPLPVQRPRRGKDAGHQPGAGCGGASGRKRLALPSGSRDGHRHTRLL